MTEPRKTTKPPDATDVVALAAEAQKLRTALERAALDGTLDLKDKHVAAHARLDELERVLYAARRLPAAEKKS